MTTIEELKAEKKKLEAEKAKLQKAAKAKKKSAKAKKKSKKEVPVIDTTKAVAKKGKNKIPAFMQSEGKY